MQIKRFEAKNMTTALRLVKHELGEDAVILSARSIRKGKGFLGSVKYAGVEVTAAIDTKPSPSRNWAARERHGSLSNYNTPDVVVAKSDLNQNGLVSQRGAPESLLRQTRHVARKKVDAHGRNKALAALYQQLLLQEVDRGLASELVENIKQIPASEELITIDKMMVHIISILEDIGVAVDTKPVHARNPSVKVFIGTSGVGKTTTIAKLAARYANRKQRRVALITIDNYGIAAFEKLNVYSKIMGIPLKAARNRSELGQALKDFKDRDIVLIDTPGINQNDRDQIAELKNYFEKLSDIEIHLVLSTPTKERDLIGITRKLKDMPVHRLLFTKLDESSAVGNILNVLVRTSIPLSYLADGRQVPVNIKPGSLQKLLDMILQSMTIATDQTIAVTTQPTSQPEVERRTKMQPSSLVANKNSEVYHHLTCKWAKRIKPENIIKFANTHDAETQNFLPCRSCNPDRSENVDSFGSRGTGMKINSVS
ncbi:MAG: flagellar biosynthesis protein FlhF [Desulfobacterales bacterium]|jgi:flagellar biosynthesis protein FlhF